MIQLRLKAGDFIRCANIKTLPYPGFPTDMQPQMAAVLTMANGGKYRYGKYL